MRNKFNPNFINTVLGGMVDGERYLCTVDVFGAKLENEYAL
jgi:hypothetical protein